MLYEDTTSFEVMWRHREDELYASTFMRGKPVHDPIFTPLFTTIFGVIEIGSTGLTVAGVASALATTALSIGLQAMLAPKPPKPEDGKAPLSQAIPYRIYGYGETRVAGARMLWEAKGSNLCIVQALCAHPVVEFVRFYFHDDIVTIGPETDPDERNFGLVNPLPGGRYEKGGAWLYYRYGEVPETPYHKVVELMEGDGAWTDDHRGDGQASLAIIAQNPKAQDFSQTFPYGAPAGSAVMKLQKVWDYRISDDPTDPAALVWSQNAALIMAHHQCLNPFGHRRDYRKAILPILDMWIEEADICDEDVPRAGGGSEKRYEFNIWDTTENGPKTTTNAILAACDGWICERGDGALLFTVGKFRESRCGVWTDADIAGYDYDDDVLPEDEINRLVPKFNYPDTDYSTAETDYFEDLDAQNAAGRVFSTDMDLRGVQQWRQARRLGLREFRRIRTKKSGSLNLWTCGINGVYKRWNVMETPILLPELNGKTLENANSILDLTRGGFTTSWRLHPENLEDWNPSVDEGEQPPVPPSPSASGIETPVINLIQSKANGQSVYIRVDIIDPEDDSIYPVVRYRLDDDGSGNPGQWIEKQFPDAEPVAGFIKLNTDVVPTDKLLDIEVAFIGGNRKYGDWTLTQEISSTVDTVKPDTPTSLLYSSGAGTFSARAANTTAPDGRTAYLTFKMGTTAQSYAAATQVDKLAAQPGDVRLVDITSPGTGLTRRLWCNSENISGLLCDTPAYIDVTFP